MHKRSLNFLKLKMCQTLSSFSFWLMIVLSVITLFLLKSISAQNSKDVRVLLYNDDSEIGEEIIEKLLNLDTDGFDFEECSSEDEASEKVRRSEVACAIVFNDDLDKGIKKGKIKKDVIFYQSAQSTSGYLVREMVFPFILEALSDKLLENYILENNVLESDKTDSDETASDGTASAVDALDEVLKAVADGNSDFRNNTDINIFNTIEIDAVRNDKSIDIDIVWGIMLWLLFAATLFSEVESEKSNAAVYKAVGRSERLIFRLLSAICYSIPFGIIISLIFRPSRILLMVAYGIVCSLYTVLLFYIVRTSKRYLAIITTLVVLSLVVSPVIADFSIYFMPLTIIRRLFPIIYFM